MLGKAAKKLIGLKIGAAAKLGHEDQTSEAYQKQLQTVMNRASNLAGDHGEQAALQKAMAADVSANKANLEREGYSSQQIQSVQDGLTESAGLNEQIGTTSQVSNSLGMAASISAVDFGGVARDNSGNIDRRSDDQKVAGMRSVIGLARADRLSPQAAMEAQQFAGTFDNNSRGKLRAQALGSLMALQHAATRPGASDMAVNHYEEAVKMLYPAMGGNAPEGYDPENRLLQLTIPSMSRQYQSEATHLGSNATARIEQPGVADRVHQDLSNASATVHNQGQAWQQDVGNAHALQSDQFSNQEAPNRAEAESSFQNEDHLSSMKEIFGGGEMTKLEGGGE